MIKTILLTLGTLALIKALVVLLFDKSLIAWILKTMKKESSVKTLVLIEVIIALILLICGYFIR